MKGRELKEIRKKMKLTQTEFGKKLGVTMRTVQNWEADVNFIPKTVELVIQESTDISHITNENKSNNANEPNEFYKKENNLGVPYYDLDFTAGFLEVTNNQGTKPDSYINHPFFKGCDYVVRASGQSMAKVISHGDAIGLIKLNNWQDFFPFGEIYAIVTNDNFRMIKVITQGDSEEHYTLISKPTDGKKDEFPPQQIKKSSISAIFRVQASSHLF